MPTLPEPAHFDPEDLLGEGDRARALCQRLLCDEPVGADELDEPGLAEAVASRLDACGFRLAKGAGRLVAVADPGASGEQALAYSQPQLAAIAQLAIELRGAPAPGSGARLSVADFHARFARRRGWSKGWLRRAVLGPLERDGYVRVVAPGQRRADEYIEAGPRLHAIDLGRLERALAEIGADG